MAGTTVVVTLLSLTGGGGHTGAELAPAPVSWVEQAAHHSEPGAAALAAARASGERVEVVADRTETGQLFANPDGTFTSEEKSAPVRVRQGGGWVPVDTTLARGPDGTVRPAAVPVSLTFSGGGDGPLVRLGRDGRELALSWPTPLPVPTLEGETAVYRNVLSDVDLRLRAAVAAVAVGPDNLSLRPDQRLLADPRTSYPVYIFNTARSPGSTLRTVPEQMGLDVAHRLPRTRLGGRPYVERVGRLRHQDSGGLAQCRTSLLPKETG